MGVDNTKPWEHPEISDSDGRRYVLGYVLTLALLGTALLLVRYHLLPEFELISTVAVLALLTTLAKLILLFHLDFSETQRWNTLTLILNIPLLILSVGLTSWMFGILYERVMMH